jgi:predicted DNA-binding protein (UPF0251 family)
MTSPDKDAPKAIRKLIDNFAGKNPFGGPNWRVCLAQNVRAMRGGIFHTMPNGDAKILGVGPRGEIYQEKIRPTRVTSGYMEVPKYPHLGWIMERWFPAHMYGSPQSWYAHKGADGTPMMGPFPAKGGFFMINGPFAKMPDWADMENAIAHYECTQRLKPADMAMALKMQIKHEMEEIEARRLRFEEELEQYRKSEILPVLRSTSLSAQGIRNELQKAVGEQSHLPAGCA